MAFLEDIIPVRAHTRRAGLPPFMRQIVRMEKDLEKKGLAPALNTEGESFLQSVFSQPVRAYEATEDEDQEELAREKAADEEEEREEKEAEERTEDERKSQQRREQGGLGG